MSRFSEIRLRPRIPKPGWIIAGKQQDRSIEVLAILQKVVPKDLAEHICLLMAERLGLEQEKISLPLSKDGDLQEYCRHLEEINLVLVNEILMLQEELENLRREVRYKD